MHGQDLFPIDENVRSYKTGLLPDEALLNFIEAGYISASECFRADQLQPASLDLRVGSRGYRVPASFLPGSDCEVSKKLGGLSMYEVDLREGAYLEVGAIYILEILESLKLPIGYSARATPKSTTGRLDIFTRLITDYSDEFEAVQAGYAGRLFLEVCSRSFAIIVRKGDTLNQMRIRRGAGTQSDALLHRLHKSDALVRSAAPQKRNARISRGLWLHVDLFGEKEGSIVGYRARLNARQVIDLGKHNFYEVHDFWDPIFGPLTDGLVLHPGEFCLLASLESISVPPQAAAEMVPYDTSMGEFRVHYAGFFDPGFGHNGGGARAVLEVRSHDVPFLLEHGQRVGRLVYERLTATPDKLYGAAIGSSYQSQGLMLAKQFRRMV